MNVVLKRQISAAEFLQGELLAEIKHELIAGEVFAMAGAGKNHERILTAGQIAEAGGAGGKRAAQVGAETAVQQVGIRVSRPQVAELQGFGDDAVVLAQAAEIDRVIQSVAAESSRAAAGLQAGVGVIVSCAGNRQGLAIGVGEVVDDW